jgi:hypothetical protein
MGDLETYFKNNVGSKIDKWAHYFDIYERHFSRYRGNAVNVMEIGVSEGGSLLMWKYYFGDKAKIYGIDIDPECANIPKVENIQIIIGSQSDRKFLRKLKSELPKMDILIDDGGHMMDQQRITFEEMFQHVSNNGIYLCEDLHTSYDENFGGGHKKVGTFIEYTKNLIDRLNAHSSQTDELPITYHTLNIDSIHYYDSVIVIEKKNRTTGPVSVVTGG